MRYLEFRLCRSGFSSIEGIRMYFGLILDCNDNALFIRYAFSTLIGLFLKNDCIVIIKHPHFTSRR